MDKGVQMMQLSAGYWQIWKVWLNFLEEKLVKNMIMNESVKEAKWVEGLGIGVTREPIMVIPLC